MAAKTLAEAIERGICGAPMHTVDVNLKNEITDFLAHEVERFYIKGRGGKVTSADREMLIKFFNQVTGKKESS